MFESRAGLPLALGLIAALGVSACGRKAGLDPPPASSLYEPSAAAAPASTLYEPAAAAAAAAGSAPPGEPLGLDSLALQAGAPPSSVNRPPPPQPPAQGSLTFMPEAPPSQAAPIYGPDGKPVLPKPPEKKWFFLDWLID